MPSMVINLSHDDITRIVCTSLHESIKNIASMYDYGEYPDYVEQDLAALNKVYQYYSGKEITV